MGAAWGYSRRGTDAEVLLPAGQPPLLLRVLSWCWVPPASPLSKLCFLFQTKLNPAPSSLQKHSASAAMGSLQPRRCSHMFMGVEIWKELNPLVRQGYRRACVHGEKQTPRFNENHLKGERCKGESPKRSAPARGRGTGRRGGTSRGHRWVRAERAAGDRTLLKCL